MDPMDPNEIQEVRKIIESSTSKVSLRDLEKKGFRKVKVLRSNDIDELIRRAVTAVVAREGSAEVPEELVERSRKELKQLMAAAQAAEQERAEILSRNEQLETQVRDLQSRATMVKELQRRLADEQELRRQLEAKAGDADLGAMTRGEEAERRAREAEGRARTFEQQLEEARRQLNETARKQARGESEGAELRRRLEDTEARAQANESRAARGDEANQKLAALREEAAEIRSQLKRAETERRLLEELEVPKLRERIQELETELRVQRAAAATAPKSAGNDESMKAMFRDLLKEVGVGAGAGADGMKAEFAKLQNTIAQSLAQAGGRGSQITEADIAAAKVSIEALFKHDAGAAAVQSNIQDVTIQEKTTTSDLKGKMDKLKSLRKGGKSE